MAAAIIDPQRIKGLIRGTLATTTAISDRATIALEHEALDTADTRPAIKVMGFSELTYAPRRGGGLSGSEPDSADGAIVLAVRYMRDDELDGQLSLEGILGLLRKHMTERCIENITSAVGPVGDRIAASGHKVDLLDMGVTEEFDGENDRDRIAAVTIRFSAQRVSGNDLLCEAA